MQSMQKTTCVYVCYPIKNASEELCEPNVSVNTCILWKALPCLPSKSVYISWCCYYLNIVSLPESNSQVMYDNMTSYTFSWSAKAIFNIFMPTNLALRHNRAQSVHMAYSAYAHFWWWSSPALSAKHPKMQMAPARRSCVFGWPQCSSSSCMAWFRDVRHEDKWPRCGDTSQVTLLRRVLPGWHENPLAT